MDDLAMLFFRMGAKMALTSSGWLISLSRMAGIKKSSSICQFVFIVSSLYHGASKATDSPQPVTPDSSFTSRSRKFFVLNVPKLVVNGLFKVICICLTVTSLIFITHFPQVAMFLFLQKSSQHAVRKLLPARLHTRPGRGAGTEPAFAFSSLWPVQNWRLSVLGKILAQTPYKQAPSMFPPCPERIPAGRPH